MTASQVITARARSPPSDRVLSPILWNIALGLHHRESSRTQLWAACAVNASHAALLSRVPGHRLSSGAGRARWRVLHPGRVEGGPQPLCGVTRERVSGKDHGASGRSMASWPADEVRCL